LFLEMPGCWPAVVWQNRGSFQTKFVTTQVTGAFASKGEFVWGIQVRFTSISAGHLAR
jgi:hypothetical protein